MGYVPVLPDRPSRSFYVRILTATNALIECKIGSMRIYCPGTQSRYLMKEVILI